MKNLIKNIELKDKVRYKEILNSAIQRDQIKLEFFSEMIQSEFLKMKPNGKFQKLVRIFHFMKKDLKEKHILSKKLKQEIKQLSIKASNKYLHF